jgi:hypothetical protein
MMKSCLKNTSVIFVCMLLVSSCGLKNQSLQNGQSRQIAGGERPEWVNDPSSALGKKDTVHKAYAGMSRQYAMEQQARNDARLNAYFQAIDDMGIYGKRKIAQVTSEIGVSSDIVNPAIVQDELTKLKSEGVALGEIDKWHIERYEKNEGGKRRNFYIAHCLFKVPRSAAEQFIEKVLQKQAAVAESQKQKENINRAIELRKKMDASDW